MLKVRVIRVHAVDSQVVIGGSLSIYRYLADGHLLPGAWTATRVRTDSRL